MIAILPSVILFALCITLFIRETKLDHQQFLERDRLADEHILKEVERFISEQQLEENRL